MQTIWSRPTLAAALRWTLLGGFITVVYAAVVGGVGGWLWPSGHAAIALSFLAAAISAAGARPVLRLVDRLIRRTLLHQTLTPYRALATAARLPAAERDSQALLALARVLAEAAGARTAAVWLAADGALTRAADWTTARGTSDPAPSRVADLAALRAVPGIDHAVPIEDDGSQLGALSIGKHGPGSVTAADDRLLRDAANSAGLLLRAGGRNAELQDRLRQAEKLELELASSQERLLRARELERQRVASEITTVTTDSLAAIATELGNLDAALDAERGDAEQVLRRLRPALDDLIDRFRAVVRGVYPGVLRDAGPRTALEELATGLPRSILITGGFGERADWELESGLYYVAATALNLLGRQRSAHPLRVHLARTAGRLAVRADESAPEPGAAAALRAALVNDVDRLAAFGGALSVTESGHRLGLHAWLPDGLGADIPAASALGTEVRAAEAAPAPPPVSAETGTAHAIPPEKALPLLARVRALVGAACEHYVGGPVADALGEVAGRLDEPLRVALVGRSRSGKSTLLNALVGQEVAATDATGDTRLPTWYRHGPSCQITLYPREGPPRPLGFASTGAAGSVRLDDRPPADADRIVVDWPADALRAMTLIDSPGLDAPSGGGAERTRALLAPGDGGLPGADAIVYLMRSLSATGFDGLDGNGCVVGVGVLSHADELAGSGPGALDAAREQIQRFQRDPALWRLCRSVVPVAGLLAANGFSLRDEDFRLLQRLACLPREAGERMLLGADPVPGAPPPRTPSADQPLPDPDTRAALLDRLGVYGARLALDLVRGGAIDRDALATALLERSGLPALRELLRTRLAARADVLKARSALRAVDAVLAGLPADDPRRAALRYRLEQLRAGAHELVEIELLDRLADGRPHLSTVDADAVERLLGGTGPDPAQRLGLPGDATAADIHLAAATELDRWQRRAEHPAAPRDLRELARTATRTCEALLAAHPAP